MEKEETGRKKHKNSGCRAGQDKEACKNEDHNLAEDIGDSYRAHRKRSGENKIGRDWLTEGGGNGRSRKKDRQERKKTNEEKRETRKSKGGLTTT